MALVRTGSETPPADIESGPEPKDSFSAFDTLPNETITEIFLQAVAPHILREEEHDERALTIHITHVCRRWRRIALGLGRLWSRVAYCHYRSAPTDVVFQSRLERISAYIERSQTCDLDVQIAITDRANTSTPRLGTLWELIWPNLARTVSLRLGIRGGRAADAFLLTRGLPVDFSRLKLLRCSFELMFDGNEIIGRGVQDKMGGLAQGQSYPALEEFSLATRNRSSALYSEMLNAACVKRIDIIGSILQFARPSLTDYTSMTELTIRSFNSNFPENEAITLPNLLVLRAFNSDTHLLFKSIAAPNMREFVVADGGEDIQHHSRRGPKEHAIVFSELRSLFIVNLPAAPSTKPVWANIHPILDSNPRITHIRIARWKYTRELLSVLASNGQFIPDLTILELAGIPSQGLSKLKADMKRAMQSRPGLRIVVDGTSLKPRIVKEIKGAFGERFTDGWAPDLDDARVMTESYLGIDSPLVS